jgi:hypothetical protein
MMTRAPASRSIVTSGKFATNNATNASVRRFLHMPEQHDRRLLRLVNDEQGPEVGVLRNHDTRIGPGTAKDGFVSGCGEPELPDVDGAISARHKVAGKARRPRVIDKELHGAVRSGSSRSSTAAAAKRSASRTSSGSRSG